MNLAMIFAMLLQAGVCADAEFSKPDGTSLHVMVCPREMPAPGSDSPDAGPPKKGQVDG